MKKKMYVCIAVFVASFVLSVVATTNFIETHNVETKFAKVTKNCSSEMYTNNNLDAILVAIIARGDKDAIVKGTGGAVANGFANSKILAPITELIEEGHSVSSILTLVKNSELIGAMGAIGGIATLT